MRDFLGEDPLAGHLFVFRNRAGDRLKVLWWDHDGLAIFYKRLEEGTFRFPEAGETGRLEMTSADLPLVHVVFGLVHLHFFEPKWSPRRI